MDALKFAIQMEKDGEAYYLDQAKKNEGNSLRQIFDMLAREEHKHATILESVSKGLPYELANDAGESRQNLFAQAKDFASEIKALPEQAELYQAAVDMEQKSVDLYTGMQAETSDPVMQKLFLFLIKEEQDHLTVMEDLYSYVNRPNNWVEAAEFGVREEY